MRMRLMALLIPFVFALPAFGDPPMTTMRVEVKTLADKPIDRASVIVHFVEGRSKLKLGKRTMTTFQLKTNQDGVARVPPLPQGKIRVQVIAKGYQTFGEIFEIEEAERVIEVKLNPPQPQFSVHQ